MNRFLILVLGFLILITWAWRIVCAPDLFTWNLCFLFINILQLIYLIYQRRPINFNPELEQIYRNMFKRFKVNYCQQQYCILFKNKPPVI